MGDKRQSAREIKDTKENDGQLSSNPSKGASLLILTQVLSKLLTFLLNQLLVRFISPTLFGISSYLEFLYSTILFFSREAERLSIQRTKPLTTVRETYQSIINFGYISILIGIPISMAIMGWQFNSETFVEVNQLANYFNYTVILFWLLTILELLIEPIYSLNQYSLNFGKRSKYEGIAVFLRCIATVVVVLSINETNEYNKNGLVLLGFGIGQFIYSLTLFLAYLKNLSNYSICKYPTKLNNGTILNPDILSFWKISFIQMIFKQILTEGDKYLVNSFFSVEERGVYSVMNNYGSIIVRLLFQPIEESVRLSFTRILSQIKKSNGKDNMQHYHDALTTIKYLLTFYVQFSILIFLGGYFNGAFLLNVLLGGKTSNWIGTDLFKLFPFYICYIPFLAFNGVLEGFLMSISNAKQTKTYSYFMSVLSLFILILLYVLIEKFKYGIMGLILTNIINMTLRIIYCGRFINNYFIHTDIKINHSKILIFASQHFMILVLGYHSNCYLGETKSFYGLFKSSLICLISLILMLLLIRKDLSLLFKRFYRKHD